MCRRPHCEATEDQTTYGRAARGSQRYSAVRQHVYTLEPLPLGSLYGGFDGWPKERVSKLKGKL
ncbi:MAG: hypothetical protein ACJ8G2_00750 [Burkholderiales bacterium]